jgi:hypothetical protein
MSNFTQAILWVVSTHEDPGLTGKVEPDCGALARYGINSAANPDMPAGFFDGTMPNAEAWPAAMQRYRRDYWAPIQGDRIAFSDVATKLLDMAVNMNPPAAIRILQTALATVCAPVPVDGVMGPKTLAALHSSDPDQLKGPIIEACLDHYHAIEQAKPALERYAENWDARSRSWPAPASQMYPEAS